MTVSPAFFNPLIGQVTTITCRLTGPGNVTLTILDRDNYVIRRFESVSRPEGIVTLSWDGKDGAGEVVPNEAYSFNLLAEAAGGRSEYAPSREFRPELFEPSRSYSLSAGVLQYELKTPARVHVQAGEAAVVGDPKAGKREGPVLKTIVDREPRAAGSVIELWDGYDESGTVNVPLLKDFVLSILAESLPENSLIVSGGRDRSFRSYAQGHRKGLDPVYPVAVHAHGPGQHHQGLNALDDYCPRLDLSVKGRKDGEGRIVVDGDPVELVIRVSADDAEHFVRPDGFLAVFVDGKSALSRKGPPNPARLSLPGLSNGEHLVAVNWASGHGPTSAQVVRILRGTTKEAGK